jgi:hypothetical protein
MAPTPAEELSAPGAVRYDSETMTVGDGTWDFNKNTFLLPNLQGLNFDTMRYNGELARSAHFDGNEDATNTTKAWEIDSRPSPNITRSS